jgi:hypothetical protein
MGYVVASLWHRGGTVVRRCDDGTPLGHTDGVDASTGWLMMIIGAGILSQPTGVMGNECACHAEPGPT